MAERLLLHPDALVGVSDPMAAAYPDPDHEADSAEMQVRQPLHRFRARLRIVSGQAVTICSERGVGYAMWVPRVSGGVVING